MNKIFSVLTLLAVIVGLSAGQSYAKAADAGSVRPLLVIRFNQEHVYYSRALKQAVANAEKVKPDVRYNVVSSLPSGKRKGQVKVSAEQAKANLSGVTTMMQQLGVPESRMSSSTENSSSVSSQEIKIYVE